MNLQRRSRLPASLLVSLSLTLGAAVEAASGAAAPDPTDETRNQVLGVLADHPEDAGLQREGERLLQALDAWQAQLRRSRPSSNPDDTAPASADAGNGHPQEIRTSSAPLPTPLAGLDLWNLNENYLSVGVAEVDWTIDRERFPGTKLALAGQYSFIRGQAKTEYQDCDCPTPPVAHRLSGRIGFDFLWGDGDLEYSRISLSGLTYQRNWIPESRRFEPIRDTLEWGVLTAGHNDYLGIDSYYELTVARAGRTWGWRGSDSGWLFTTGVGLSGGWAWAESVNSLYRDVSNPFAGTWIALGMAHPRLGKFQVEQRVIQGFTISNPSEGESTSREAIFRAAYSFNLPSCLSGELSIEKNSFAFSNFSMPDLYEKSRRVNLFVGCVW